MMLLALVLFAQTLSLPLAYTTTDVADPDHLIVAMQSGRYAVELGPGCDGITVGMAVQYLPGSRGVGALQPAGSDVLCNVQIVNRVSDEPCAANDDGECDITEEVIP